MRPLFAILSFFCLFFCLVLPKTLPLYGMDFEGQKLILPVSPEKKRYIYNSALTGKAEGKFDQAQQEATLPVKADSALLSLEEAIQSAVQTHPSIRAAVQLLVQQGYLVSAAKAGYLPQIGVSISTERESNEDLAVTPSIHLSQMLYDFGRTKSEVFSARAGLAKQTILAMDQVDNIISQTASALINVHHYQEQLKSAEMQIRNVSLVVEKAKQRAQSGLTSESDPVQAETRLEAARANLLSVETLFNQSKEQLALLIGFKHPGFIDSMDPALLARADLYNTPDFNNMTVVLQAHADYNMANAQLTARKAAYFPTIGLIASMEKTLTGENPTTGIEEDTHNTVGLNVSQSLYQGGRVYSQHMAAASARESAIQSLGAAELRAKELIYVSRLEIEGLMKKRQILARRTANIKATRGLYDEQYSLGTRSVLDLLNSEQEVYQAISEELAAEHDYWKGLVNFLILKGDARGIFGAHSAIEANAS